MTPTDQRVDKLETSLRETIDEMQTDIHELKRQIDSLAALTTFLRKRVMSIEAEQEIQRCEQEIQRCRSVIIGAEQTAQAVSESSAWQDVANRKFFSADDPPA